MAKSVLVLALEQLEREKNIRKDDVLKMIEEAVVNSLRKHVGMDAVIEASIDPETAEFLANVVKTVVETVVEPDKEIGLAEAKRHKKDAAVGEQVRLPAPVTDFGIRWPNFFGRSKCVRTSKRPVAAAFARSR